jgi:predicted neuraminidase
MWRSLSFHFFCTIAITVARVSAEEQTTNPVPKSVLSAQFIYETAPYPECHASTIVELAPGKLAAAWFGGTRERAPDVCIWFAIYQNGKWQEQKKVADGVQPDGTRMPTWNPVLFQPPSGPLYLFYKVGPAPASWWGMFKTSTDGGATWSSATRLPDGVLGPIKNKPIVLQDGTWLAGSSTESDGQWRVHFERSTDAGRTWTVIGPVANDSHPTIRAIQPSVLICPGGKLQAVCRTQNGFLASTWSTDQGLIWSPLAKMDLPNPNSGIDAVTLRDGRQLLVYNNSAPPPERPTKGLRYPLDVAISNDGISWNHELTLDSDPIANGYAYPAVIQSSDGLVHITYTYDRKRIKHVIVDPSKF